MGSAQHVFDYQTTTDFIINHINIEFAYSNDITTALETLQDYAILDHKPTLHFSSSKDETIKAMEDEQHKIEFKTDYNEYRNRKKTYETNLIRHLLWSGNNAIRQCRASWNRDKTLPLQSRKIPLSYSRLSSKTLWTTRKIDMKCQLYVNLLPQFSN